MRSQVIQLAGTQVWTIPDQQDLDPACSYVVTLDWWNPFDGLYIGPSLRSARYLGTKTDAELYLGAAHAGIFAA